MLWFLCLRWQPVNPSWHLGMRVLGLARKQDGHEAAPLLGPKLSWYLTAERRRELSVRPGLFKVHSVYRYPRVTADMHMHTTAPPTIDCLLEMEVEREQRPRQLPLPAQIQSHGGQGSKTTAILPPALPVADSHAYNFDKVPSH